MILAIGVPLWRLWRPERRKRGEAPTRDGALAVVAVEISPVWASFSFFVVLIAILLVRPQGFFGAQERTL